MSGGSRDGRPICLRAAARIQFAVQAVRQREGEFHAAGAAADDCDAQPLSASCFLLRAILQYLLQQPLKSLHQPAKGNISLPEQLCDMPET